MVGEKSRGGGFPAPLKIAGAFCALCIGAGFATGQEIMQFFVVHGYKGLAAMVISFFIFLFMATEFLKAGKTLTEEQQKRIMTHYFGPRLGFGLDWFCTIFLYCVYIIMLAGSAAIFSEYFGLPGPLGSAAMALLCLLVVLLGLQKMVDVLGFVGPVIVVFALVVAVANLAFGYDNLSDVERLLPTLTVPATSSWWWLSGLLYPAFMFFTLAPILPRIGSVAKTKKEAAAGGVLGCVFYHLALAAATLAMLANLGMLAGKQVPMLTLASQLCPGAAVAFAFIILAGIFTTAVPLLYNTCARFTKEKTGAYDVLALFLSVLAVAVGSLFPFDVLVNAVYGYAGYLGILLLAVLFIR